MHTVPVIGVPVAATDYQGAVDWTLAKAVDGSGAYALEAANTHVLALASHDPQFGDFLSRFDLVVPDGMPLVWAINASLPPSAKLSERVYGPTLMLEVIKATAKRPEYRHFLLGGKQSTLDALQARFRKDFPDTIIAGSHSPPFGEWPADEFDRICDQIRQSGANIIWVGLGCPKQETWIAQHKDRLPDGVYFGIGAAFAFHAGEVKQSPPFLQKIGMEWAYRLAMEPRRLFRRYLVYNTLFLYQLVKERISENPPLPTS